MSSKQLHTITRRQLLRRGAFVGGAAVVGPTLLTACPAPEDDTLEAAREQGFVRIGFANEAPYGFADAEGRPTGQAPTVAAAVMERLDVPEVAGTITEWGGLIPGLAAGHFDIVAAGMFITPDRCEEALFSDPDYCAPQALAVAEGNPLGLSDYDSIAADPDVTLGVMAGAIEEDQAEAAGVDPGQIDTFDTDTALRDALLADRIDAFALTSITVRELIEGQPLEKTEAFVPVIDGEEQLGCGGYAFRLGDEDFRDEFNAALVQMKEAGEILPLIDEFGFGEAEVSAALDQTAEDHGC